MKSMVNNKDEKRMYLVILIMGFSDENITNAVSEIFPNIEKN